MAHLLLSWLHFVPYSSEEASAKKAGLSLELKLKCPGSVPKLAVTMSRAPSLPLLANLKKGLSDPAKTRRGDEVARRRPALCQRRAGVQTGS